MPTSKTVSERWMLGVLEWAKAMKRSRLLQQQRPNDQTANTQPTSMAWRVGTAEWAKQSSRSRSLAKRKKDTDEQAPMPAWDTLIGSKKTEQIRSPGIGNVQSGAQLKTEKAMVDRTPRRWFAENKGFVLACVAVAIFAWMFRFDLKPSASPRIVPYVYVLDRWTGNVNLVEVKEREAQPEPGERRK